VASGFNLNINDSRFREMLNEYKKTVNEVSAMMDQEIASYGELMATSAKNMAPVDTGRLRSSISLKKEQFLSYELVAQTNYAAYVEFGTGKYFISNGEPWDGIASKYKGRGIKEVNLLARPYMRPSIMAYMPSLTKAIYNLINEKKKV
jgi:hypothetical protein